MPRFWSVLVKSIQFINRLQNWREDGCERPQREVTCVYLSQLMNNFLRVFLNNHHSSFKWIYQENIINWFSGSDQTLSEAWLIYEDSFEGFRKENKPLECTCAQKKDLPRMHLKKGDLKRLSLWQFLKFFFLVHILIFCFHY